MQTVDSRPPERFAAGVLATASIAGLVAMAFHPNGHDLLHGADPAAAATRTRLVHATAIAALWLQACGVLALARRVRRPTIGLAELACAGQLLAVTAGTIAAVASGFLAPRLAAAAPPAAASWQLNGMHNRVFAQLFVVASAVATTLWSWAGRRVLSRSIVGLGIVIGVATTGLVTTGALRLSVHGMGAIVLLQSVWQIGVAIGLWRPARGRPGAPDRGAPARQPRAADPARPAAPA